MKEKKSKLSVGKIEVPDFQRYFNRRNPCILVSTTPKLSPDGQQLLFGVKYDYHANKGT